MVADTKLSERCNYDNFENKEVVDEMTQKNFEVRVFLLSTRSKNMKAPAQKPGLFDVKF